jgi:hypothetical protein
MIITNVGTTHRVKEDENNCLFSSYVNLLFGFYSINLKQHIFQT